MDTVRDICRAIGSQIVDSAVCVETGCMYVLVSPEDEVHTTTNNIYEFVVSPHGILYSLDIDREHIVFAEDFLGEVAPDTLCFIEGDSVDSLEKLSRDSRLTVDLLCLDSREFDEDHMVREYEAIKVRLHPSHHFVLVDDVHNPNSVKHKKMVPLLKSLGYAYIEVPTPTGMFVAAKGYDLP